MGKRNKSCPPPQILDKTDVSASELQENFKKLIKEGYVLRGVNCSEEELEHIAYPRVGNDVSRESGRRYGVYATDEYRDIFAYALFSKRAIQQHFNNFVTTFSRIGDVQYIGLEPEIYEFAKNYRNKVFTDGFIKVFHGELFESASDAPHELVAPGPQCPEMIYKIGAHIADELFVTNGNNPTVLPVDEIPNAQNGTD